MGWAEFCDRVEVEHFGHLSRSSQGMWLTTRNHVDRILAPQTLDDLSPSRLSQWASRLAATTSASSVRAAGVFDEDGRAADAGRTPEVGASLFDRDHSHLLPFRRRGCSSSEGLAAALKPLWWFISSRIASLIERPLLSAHFAQWDHSLSGTRMLRVGIGFLTAILAPPSCGKTLNFRRDGRGVSIRECDRFFFLEFLEERIAPRRYECILGSVGRS